MTADPSAPNEIIDIAFLEGRREIADSLLEELIAVFNREVPTLISGIKSAYQAQNRLGIQTLAHKLKGICLNMGAVALGQLAESIELGRLETMPDSMKQLDIVFRTTTQQLMTLVSD